VSEFAIFRYHANGVGLSKFLLTYGLFAVPENPTLEPKITTLSYTEPEL